jgi:hypothetical protein
MQTYQNHYEEILDYLKVKYKRVTIGKKELSNELGIALGTLDLYMSRGIGAPRYKKLGDKPNSRVVFNINDVAEFLTSHRIETM